MSEGKKRVTTTRARDTSQKNKRDLFSTALFSKICSRISAGESLTAICNESTMPSRKTFYEWLAGSDELRSEYEHATTMRADFYAEQILAIADDSSEDDIFIESTDGSGNGARRVCNNEFVQRSKLRIDARKWYVSKLAPKKYGEKIEVDNNHTGIPTEFTIKFVKPDAK